MPRSIDGTYFLPAGNPVVSGTIIDTDWANPTLDDVAAALSDSLSRTGSGGMLVPFRNVDGNVGSPGITFTQEPTLGFYRKSAGRVGFATDGVNPVTFSSSGMEIVEPTSGSNPATKSYVDDVKTDLSAVEAEVDSLNSEVASLNAELALLETEVDGKAGVNDNEAITGTWRIRDDIPLQFGGDGGGTDGQIFWSNSQNSLIVGLRVGSGFAFSDVGLNGLIYDPGLFNFSYTCRVAKPGANVGDMGLEAADSLSMDMRFYIGKPSVPLEFAYFGVAPGFPSYANIQLSIKRNHGTFANYTQFYGAGDVLVGGVATFGYAFGNGPYNDISDRKTKENIREMTSSPTTASSVIAALKPVLFDKIAQYGGAKNQPGFIADEVEQVLPALVNVVDDGTRSRPLLDARGEMSYESKEDEVAGKPIMETYNTGETIKGIGLSGLIPYIVSTLQEQIQINAQLTQELDDIKSLLNQ